jgi:hypothetical protein
MGPSKLSPIDAGLSPQGRYMAPDRNFEENSVSAMSYSLGPAHLDEIVRRNKLASEQKNMTPHMTPSIMLPRQKFNILQTKRNLGGDRYS